MLVSSHEILAGACQIVCHVTAVALYWLQGADAWTASLIYNAPVLIVKYLLSGVAAFMLYKALNKAFKF
ncbi:MAG: energy-coupled thiamine transporter ThiT [Synergistaceae bacterium]|nr:energy-coupled thiamine transporter ThiT [Synergistaceae bacterium]